MQGIKKWLNRPMPLKVWHFFLFCIVMGALNGSLNSSQGWVWRLF